MVLMYLDYRFATATRSLLVIVENDLILLDVLMGNIRRPISMMGTQRLSKFLPTGFKKWYV